MPYRQDSDFYYLTGWTEPGAALLIVGDAPHAASPRSYKEILFLPARDLRMETYTGVKMTQIGFLEFWEFLWTERGSLWRFLKWTGEMDRYVHPGAKNP